MTSAIYRSEVIGSLLRPSTLKSARADFEAGAITAHELKRVEDRSVDRAIAFQESIGLPVVTDGEMRRGYYAEAMYGDFDGIAPIADSDSVFAFRDSSSDEVSFPIPLAVHERLSRRRLAAAEEYAYARAKARVPVKVTMPNPLVFGFMWSEAHSRNAYPDVQAMLEDAATLLRQEALELARQGCAHIQVDLPELTMVVDERSRANWERIGLSVDWLMHDGMALVDGVAADVPEVRFCVHFCRGNHASKWLSQGGYGAMSEAFARLPHFDTLLLEYDSDRAGGFEPLRDVPDDKTVFLGLVSTKVASLETPEAILRRIDEASEFFPRDQLAVSTQCGFASAVEGNNLTQDDQEAKLRLVCQVAERAWGELEVAV